MSGGKGVTQRASAKRNAVVQYTTVSSIDSSRMPSGSASCPALAGRGRASDSLGTGLSAAEEEPLVVRKGIERWRLVEQPFAAPKERTDAPLGPFAKSQ